MRSLNVGWAQVSTGFPSTPTPQVPVPRRDQFERLMGRVIDGPRGEGCGKSSIYAVLDQVIHLLRQRGRVAWVLKLQCTLNDEAVEALKDELIYSQRLAVDGTIASNEWAEAGFRSRPMPTLVRAKGESGEIRIIPPPKNR